MTCPTCSHDGTVITDTWELHGSVREYCGCQVSEARFLPFIGPTEPTSAWLVESAGDEFDREMQAEGKKECWVCLQWKPNGDWSRMCPDCRDEF